MNNVTNNFFRPHHVFYVLRWGMFDLEAASKNILIFSEDNMKKQKNQVIQTIASYGLGSSSSSNESTIKTVSQMGVGGGWGGGVAFNST